ncbi:hypothetical protein SLW70_09345 [Flavobacterium sp. NG2]|uniref:hypothetical protein n=1 Tax=Flavobacterium sp. NG2 TaxID=3097547 RepID=UPI002A81504E|nr:hypothetical protein [Flavobacterium sp. NG2]WPR70155.1 hypothetical protein SLW70_09345 [Flavobacterium sp. NG2]
MKKLIVLFFLPICCLVSTHFKAQSLQHPAIWVTNEERPQILEKIKKYDWAKSMLNQLHQRVDGALQKHQSDPNVILNTIPAFAKHDRENSEQKAGPLASAHNKVLALASDAGYLYYLTQDEKYAQFAADILGVYIDHIAPLTPQTTTICGYEFFDPRTTYGPFAITYDFIYPYLKQANATVYSKIQKKRIPFDNVKAQKAMANVVGNVLQEYGKPDKHGKTISNHPILTASGALFSILCIEDDKERQRLFNVFWEKGTAHQNSFKNTILPMFGEQGVWPESLSYSFMPIITMTLNIVDRIYPEMNVTQENQHILNGNFLFDYLRHPNRTFVRFGDSKRNNDSTDDLYRYTLDIAERRGYDDIKQKAQLALKQTNEANGGYKPKLDDNIFNNFQILDLFWGHPIPEKIDGHINFNKPTVIVKHAGVALQRNYVAKENEIYGLCGIIGGASYVHSHLTGISMELYGAGYVMAANAGLPATVAERKIPLHEKYFRLYAGNNSVIVNGSSHGLDEGSWKGDAYVWQNNAINIAAEPKHLENPIAENFSFATQFLKDEVNNCVQERTLSTIRTSEKTAYYLDIFRSKSNGENKFHDYIYHNIGDETIIKNEKGQLLPLKDTDRYNNDIGDPVQSPGWRYFEKTKVTESIKDGVDVTFKIDFDKKYMHMMVPKGVEREYTAALAPPTREAENGYLKKKTQVVAIRQKGEAWNKPFIAVFEPSLNSESSVQSVEPLMDGNKVVGAKVISKVNKTLITDYIICQDKADSVYSNRDLKLNFEGRFGIVRVEEVKGKKTVSLYMGEGKKLSFQNFVIEPDTQSKGFKVFK